MYILNNFILLGLKEDLITDYYLPQVNLEIHSF